MAASPAARCAKPMASRAASYTTGWGTTDRRAFETRVPLGRVADTDEIKGLALFLASEASSFVTGAQVVIDGGASLGAV
ncbi:SDR family oxidoreductase [Salinisphaera orenii]|uniref:SDR family oxidoreductase n=1 Tax=Salinisphaera orenii TaxID=856731 RepID=UPI001C841E03|nr:SDR family oxidoreductase [Salinisphaera orenii]